MSETILTSDALRRRLTEDLSGAKNIILLSAFLTEDAIDWLTENISNATSVTIVGRFLPKDFVVGASSIRAISKSLDNNWSVSCLSDLHAKIYVIDNNNIFVGSANFTSMGLKLHGHGNLEASIEINASKQNIEFVDNVISNSTQINRSILAEMEAYISQHKNKLKDEGVFSKWPEVIFPKDQKVWVTNFPWVDLAEKNNEESAIEHDKYVFGDNNELFFQSKAYNWLCSVLKEKEGFEIYFGELTAQLHADLKDDPTPYRKNVKQLLSNLLGYCDKYASKNISIDRPKHSQRIRLINENTAT